MWGGVQLCCLLAIVEVSSNWQGYWVGNPTNPYSLFSCLDSSNHWNALLQDSLGATILRFNGTLQHPTNPTIIGQCTIPPRTIPFNLGDFISLEVFEGNTIRFTSDDLQETFSLSLQTSSGLIIEEFLTVLPGTQLLFSINKTVMASYELDQQPHVYVYLGYSLVGFISINVMGEVLVAKIVSYLSTPKMLLSIQCDYIEDPTSALYRTMYYPVSGYVDDQCGDQSRLWIGSWRIQLDGPLYLGDWWFVCPSSSGGLVSSFSDPPTIAGIFTQYYMTESIEVGFYSLKGKVGWYINNNWGDFYFDLNQNKTSFSGYIVIGGETIGIVGTLVVSTPHPYLCSPFDMFGGLWVDTQYSSWMMLCVNNSVLKGSYFGGSILVSGTFKWNTNNFQAEYITSPWALILDTYNTRTNETSSVHLYMDKNTDPKPILYLNNGQTFATPQYKTISDCNSIPSTWGTFSEDLFSSHLYMCTDNGNIVYGSLNSGNYLFKGSQTDINLITGKLTNIDLTFNWILEGNKISAEYKDENGVTVNSLMYKISDDVTLSQCTGSVQFSAYMGTWVIGESSLSFCQVSETEVEGKMNNYYFSGVFKDGLITGNYFTSDLSYGNWTAITDTEEKDIVLTMDNNNTIIGTISTRVNSYYDCGSWRKYWEKSFGTASSISHLLGGCFSVCLNKKTEFTIIFYNTELHGNGTLDLFTGELSGYLQNGLNFTISIDSGENVNANFQDSNGENVTIAYSLCSYLPSNYTTNAYPTCFPTRFEPTVPLSSTPILNLLDFNQEVSRKGGVDITPDGKLAIIASGNTTFLMAYSDGTWTQDFQFVLPDPYLSTPSDYFIYGGNPVAITNTHAFTINLWTVHVFQNFSGKWINIGSLDPPPQISPFPWRPYFVTKSCSDDFSVLQVTWKSYTISYISLHNISKGKADLSPFATSIVIEPIFSVAIHTSWLVYSTFGPTLQVKAYYCEISQSGIPSPCPYMILTTVASQNDIASLGIGFSLAVNSNYLFVGAPPTQNNNGTVYVYKYNKYLWKLSQILNPADSGLHQSFGRNIITRDNYLMILKAQDNTVRPFSMALILYTLSPSNLWTPKFKFVSEDWPAKVPPSYKKRQYFSLPSSSPMESVLYWSMSDNGTLFTTSPSLDSFTHSWYDCADWFWGVDCSLPCPCIDNSTCINTILGYTCSCMPNTYGVNCEKQCKNCHGARCDDGPTGSGICLCNSSQYGPECLPCSCQHGNCSSGPNGTGLCTCYDGFTGQDCETKIIDNTLIISLSVVIPCVVLAFLAVLLYFLCRKPQIQYDLSDIPEELLWYFDIPRIKTESGWDIDPKGWMVKDVKEDKRYLNKLKDLMKTLDGVLIEWTDAYAVCNPTLQNNFLGYRQVTLNRHKASPGIFKKNYNSNEKRDWVMEQYHNLVNSFPWNEKLELPIIPVVHGTSLTIAKSICATGFAALSSLDSGFYGKGIYTTSSCLYALPYYAPKSKPAILICLITPGNVNPIIEDLNDVVNWSGKLIPNGFQTHYVITSKSGKIYKKEEEGKFFDEFVTPTEGQLLPIYILSVFQSAVSELLQEYQREVFENTNKSSNQFNIV